MKGKRLTAIVSVFMFMFSLLVPYITVISVAEANTPAITITSPNTDRVFTNSVSLNANITNGTVTDVYKNGERLGSTTLPFTVTDLRLGQNTLMVRASNVNGISEAVVNVVYDDEPQLTNLTPVNATVVNGSFNVSGEYENTTTLTIRVNNSNTPVFSQTFSPIPSAGTILSTNIPVSSLVVGTNTITFEASNGTKSISKNLQVTYAPPAPTVFNISPASGSKVFSNSGNTVTISGQISADATGVTIQNVTAGGAPTTPVAAPLSGKTFSYTVTLAPGATNQIKLTPLPGTASTDIYITHEKRAQVAVTEPSGAVTTTTTSVSMPSFTWTDPIITFKGRIDNATGAGIRVNKGQERPFTPGDFTQTVDLLAGANEIQIIGRNGEGDSVVNLAVYYNGAPGLTITNPADTSVMPTVYNSRFTVTGKVAATKTLTVQREGAAEEGVAFDSQGNFSKQITLTPGRQTVTVKAKDGSAVTTKNFYVFFDDTPFITVTAPASGTAITTNKVTVSGNVQNADSNGFFINGSQTWFDSNGNFSREITLAAGATKIQLKAQKGNRTTIRDIPISNSSKPEIVISSPGDKTTTYSNIITVSGQVLGVSPPYDKLDLKVNNIATTVDSNGNFSRQVTLKQGVNTITATMKAGSSATKSIKVTYVDMAVSGSYFETKVPQNGGNIKAFENQVNINIPKGVLPGESTLSFRIREANDVTKDQNLIYISDVVRISGDRTKLDKPATLTMQYIKGIQEAQAAKVTLYYYEDDEKWVPVIAKVDNKKRTVTAEVDKLGTYAVMLYLQTFNDVVGHWAQNDIELLMAKGIAAGKTSSSFRPETPITRAELTKFIVDAMGIPKYNAPYANFDDVDDDYWAYKYIQGAARVGIVKGTSAYRFSPEQYVTRVEAAAMISRAAGFKAIKDDEATKLLEKYRDKDKIGEWARGPIAEAIKAGIINGYSVDSFQPNLHTTRAQASRMVVKLMKQQKKM
ncbi:MAG: S-layer homology domain-containing protein [Clostridia bacterium]|nr:S-layer homology domain-containing protein [Clostridia bacterium]